MKLLLKIIAYTIITMFIILNITDDILLMQYLTYFSLIGTVIIATDGIIKIDNLGGK
ncbi:hypothetical protein KYI13_03805 [Macrococcoides bohemicum]|uniref:hypothetical protein n=1 Tax=Macrococcoides bohemicum TaxID=1903056 RepID=UPI001C5CE3FD|nr:hypothetical protein [Macrococcus bohemicus]QYA45455.1 hypothetical protein KYI13_03805 [Macrococcus bohemicus]